MKLRTVTAALLASLIALSSVIMIGCTNEADRDGPSQRETGDPSTGSSASSDEPAASTRPSDEPTTGSYNGQCCFGMHMGDPGTCIECRKATPFDSHALCTACAERGGRCTHCMKTIRR